MGDDSYFTNRGEVRLDIGFNATNKPATVVQLGDNSTFDNFGVTSIAGDGDGTLVSVSGDKTRIVNRAAGVLDAQFGDRAINLNGDQNEVVNFGRIIGSDQTGVAIRSSGDSFSYIQAGRGNLRGNVVALATPQPATPNEFPDTAFLEFKTDASTNFVQDKNTTEFFGFSNVILSGPGALTLEQDFVRGETQASGVPTGHFKQFLSFDVHDPKGILTVSGAITDQPTKGGKAALNKDGPGTLALTGASTFTGNFHIYDGIVDLGGTITAPTFVENGGALHGSGEIKNGLKLESGSRIATNGKVETLTVGGMTARGGSIIQVDANENGGALNADRIDVKGVAQLGNNSVIDVVFDASTKLPALSGVNVVAADQGLLGYAPQVQLDPASLPRGQNFTLDLEATNLGGTFARPGEAIPAGAGGAGFVVLQVKSLDQNTVTGQKVVINGPYVVPTLPPVLTPPQVPVLTPGKTPILVPTLIKGPTAQVTVPVKIGKPNTGFKVVNGGAQVGGTLTPKPQNPNKVPVGNLTNVIIVEPPTNVGTTDFVSVTGNYTTVNQTNAKPGTTYRLLYKPHKVEKYLTPTNYGSLAPLGKGQSKTQQQVGKALTSTLPDPHARPSTTDQGNLIAGLYPLTLDQINPALDSIAGTGEDPTFVTVLNTRELQDAMDSRLRARRDGRGGSAVGVTQGTQALATDRTAWGEFLGRYQDGNYLNDSEIRTWGLVLGADQSLSDNFVGGVAVSYSDADIDTDTGSSDEVRSLEAAVYGSWTQDDWFVNGNMGLSYNWLEMNRRVSVGSYNDTLTGEANARSFFTGVEGGKVIATSWGAWEPTAGLRYQYVDRDSYTESGPDGLARSVSSEIMHSGQGILGVRAYGQYRGTGDVMWRPEIRAAYARELGDSDIDGHASLVSAPGTSFDVFTAGPGEDVGIFGLRLDGQGERVNYYVDYQAEARESLFGHRLRAGFEMRF